MAKAPTRTAKVSPSNGDSRKIRNVVCRFQKKWETLGSIQKVISIIVQIA